MSSKDDFPRGWECECGNVLGMMHRDNNRVVVVDCFRTPVEARTLDRSIAMFSRKDYSIIDLGIGKVVCPKCGRLNTWDASKQILRKLYKSK